MEDYIDLNRLFIEFDPDAAGNADDYSFELVAALGMRKAKEWADVLKQPCTVIIAEGGTGKTEEFRQQAKKLRRAGKAAFFCRIEHLARFPLEKALEIGTPDELTAWQQDTTQAIFFLDSVDEAKLQNPQDFEVAVIQFLDAVAPYRDRATVVISTRPHAWQARADKEFLIGRLGLREQEQAGTVEDAEEGEEGQAVAGNGHKSKVTQPALAVLQLVPLDRTRVRKFAEGRGVEDVDAFMEAIEHADADIFATRPADLPGLIKEWKAHRRIGRYSDVVRNNIDLKLDEQNPAHRKSSKVGLARLQEGATALAAAVTLTGRTNILLPDRNISEDLRQASLDPSQVLTGWTEAEIEALLARPLFDEAVQGTVRLLRPAREYMTAKWLHGLLQHRKGRRAIEGLFFAKPYGTESEVVVPGMKPIAGWLSTWDQRIRDRTMRVDPKVLLEFGDASALDVATRATLLRQFAKRYANQKHTPASFNVREVRRLSDQGLAADIKALLREYREHDDVRHLLLRMVREGRITGCDEIVLPFFLDAEMDTYTRVYAVQAIGKAGKQAAKRKVVREIIAGAENLDRRIVAAALEDLWPDEMSDTDVLAILEKIDGSRPYSSDTLEYELRELAERIPDKDRALALLGNVVELLEGEPYHGDSYCRISQKYSWLVTFAWSLAERILERGVSPETEPVLIRAIGLCEQAEHLDRYTGDTHKNALNVIGENRQLRHEMFWVAVDDARKRAKSPLVNFWQLHRPMVLLGFDQEDVPAYLLDLQRRDLREDRLVALSVLAFIYHRADKPADLLEKIRAAIGADETLKNALAAELAPRPRSPELERLEEQRREMEAQREERERKQAVNRQKWIDQLKAAPDQVGNLELAKVGNVWNYTHWLIGEMQKASGSRNTWAVPNWHSLEPEFGAEVATALRDFCKAYWRIYQPSLRSETSGDDRNVPHGVIVGLSGLAMEAAEAGWASRLGADEARRAVRYALRELNRFPSWMDELYDAHPQPVTDVLLGEIEWEMRESQATSEEKHYVLSRLFWTEKRLAKALRPELLRVLERNPDAKPPALNSVVSAVLNNPEPLPDAFRALLRKRVAAQSEDAVKAVWIAAQICIDADRGIAALEIWLKGAADAKQAEVRATRVLNEVWGESRDRLNSAHKSYENPESIVRLLKLAHTHIRIEDDLHHDEVYSPGERDHAQRARGYLLELLRKMPGKKTYDGLYELSAFHTDEYSRDYMLVLAEGRAESDAEVARGEWLPGDVPAFAAEAERTPTTQQQLYELGLSRLDDLKLDLEEGDESEASFFRKAKDEVELRRVIANRLKEAAQGKYTTGSEEELADKTRTDIRLHNPAAGSTRIPIEIKIAGRWQARELRERLHNQLRAQYLREARHGVFLVVNRGTARDTKTWKVQKARVGFEQLIEWLKEEAEKLLKSRPEIEGLGVIGIDLLRRGRTVITPGLKPKKRTPRKKRRAVVKQAAALRAKVAKRQKRRKGR